MFKRGVLKLVNAKCENIAMTYWYIKCTYIFCSRISAGFQLILCVGVPWFCDSAWRQCNLITSFMTSCQNFEAWNVGVLNGSFVDIFNFRWHDDNVSNYLKMSSIWKLMNISYRFLRQQIWKDRHKLSQKKLFYAISDDVIETLNSALYIHIRRGLLWQQVQRTISRHVMTISISEVYITRHSQENNTYF